MSVSAQALNGHIIDRSAGCNHPGENNMMATSSSHIHRIGRLRDEQPVISSVKESKLKKKPVGTSVDNNNFVQRTSTTTSATDDRSCRHHHSSFRFVNPFRSRGDKRNKSEWNEAGMRDRSLSPAHNYDQEGNLCDRLQQVHLDNSCSNTQCAEGMGKVQPIESVTLSPPIISDQIVCESNQYWTTHGRLKKDKQTVFFQDVLNANYISTEDQSEALDKRNITSTEPNITNFSKSKSLTGAKNWHNAATDHFSVSLDTSESRQISTDDYEDLESLGMSNLPSTSAPIASEEELSVLQNEVKLETSSNHSGSDESRKKQSKSSDEGLHQTPTGPKANLAGGRSKETSTSAIYKLKKRLSIRKQHSFAEPADSRYPLSKEKPRLFANAVTYR